LKGHLDAEILAEFRAGLITGRRGSGISAHLAGCERCADLDGRLAGVSVLLASVPVPAMPASVAQRLDTVLAAEAASSDQAERARVDRPGKPATGGRRTPRPGFRLLSARVLAPVAVVVLAAGAYGLSRVIAPGGQITASSASTGSSAASSAGSSAGNAAAAPVPSAASANQPVRGAEGTAPRSRRITPADFPLVVSTTDFSSAPATLKRQVEDELGTTPTPGTVLPVPPRLRACVQNLTRSASLVRVESVRFAGQPATLVVARTGPDDTAWIVGPDCSATSRDVLARTSVPPGISEP